MRTQTAGRMSLPKPRALIALTSSVLVLGMGWMALAPVDRVVHAEGRVVPAGKAQIVQHLEGGIISSMAVREGSSVKKGDLLVVVGDTRADSQLGERKIKIAGLQARVARLKAEAEGASGLASRRGPEHDSMIQRAEEALFMARRQKIAQEMEIFQEQIRQKTAEIAESESRRKSLGAELDVARHQLSVISGLSAKNAASKLELLEAQGRVQRLLTQIGDAESAMPRLRPEETRPPDKPAGGRPGIVPPCAQRRPPPRVRPPRDARGWRPSDGGPGDWPSRSS